MSLLEDLEQISTRRDDGGLLHGGHIHFIQSTVANGELDNFILKAGIYGVLERVPDVFPLDLPELVERDETYEPPDEMGKAIHTINDGLLIPINGYDVVQIIRAARNYLAKVQDA